MDNENRMTSHESPQGRRILVAVVSGEPGRRIQDWRLKHDREQALRLPPHASLCYWPPVSEPDLMEAQVRQAFSKPVSVSLGEVKVFDNDQRTFYVELRDTQALDGARRHLYDGTFVELPELTDWTWHVTCVRDSRGRDLVELLSAARSLCLNLEWTVDLVQYLELRGERYEPIASWHM